MLRPSAHSAMIGLCCLISLVAAMSTASAQWPGFRGPNTDGTVPGVRIFDGDSVGLALGWKRALGSGYSGVAVGNGKVVALFADGDSDYAAAFDVESGDELWRYRIDATYLGHDGSHTGPISTPLLYGGQVYGLSPRGKLFAVNAKSGEEVWNQHLVDDLGSTKPHYGYTTSPMVADGVLVIEVGAEGKAVAGFNPEDGKMLWSIGEDKIEYHSPIVTEIAGLSQIIAAGQKNVWGLEPRTGKALWSYEHAGDDRAMGGFSIVPVPAGDGRIFLMNKQDSSVMLQVTKDGAAGFTVEEQWTTNGIKASYVTPVYLDGYIYGMSNRIFTCIDANDGEIKWRSREPGDGFPILVGKNLVIITKPGSLHVAEASAKGYKEKARLDLFDAHSWSEVAFADGHLYARSMTELARIDLAGDASAGAASEIVEPGSAFRAFLEEVAAAADKNAAVDAFLRNQSSVPIIEDSGLVNFIYRGEAEDVGIVGDMIGFRREDPMIRIPGTDAFYYTTRLEPDAAVTYGFIADFGDPMPDPMNDQAGSGLFGDVSWLAMPAWRNPTYLGEAKAGKQGRVETVEWKSELREGQDRIAKVYLPAGYKKDGDRRYPTLYIHNGQAALDEGQMKNALDRLIGTSVAPVIAVFIIADEENPRGDMRHEKYGEMVVNELVPAIDEKFRTIAEASARASVGSGRAANTAVMMAFSHAKIFGRTAGQSSMLSPEDLAELTTGAAEQPMVIYLDWGTYHMRSPHEAWDLAVESRKLWSWLREIGYRPAGGELPEGFGWACWRGHSDELLAALYPLR